MEDIEVIYWGRPSEFFPTLFEPNEVESTLHIKIIAKSITPFGVTPTKGTCHIKRQNGREIWIGKCKDIDYLVLHGGVNKAFVDLEWSINKIKSMKADLPVSINPALLFPPWSPPTSGDEQIDQEEILNNYLREDSSEVSEVIPPPRGEPGDSDCYEVPSDGEVEDEENSETDSSPLDNANAQLSSDEEFETEADQHEESQDAIRANESQLAKASSEEEEEQEEDITEEIADLQSLIRKFSNDRRERQTVQYARLRLEEIQKNQAKKHATKQRKITLSKTAATKKRKISRTQRKSPSHICQKFPLAESSSTLSTPTTSQGNKRKADGDTRPFSNSKRAKIQDDSSDFKSKARLFKSPYTPPRHFESENDEGQADNYSEPDDDDDEEGEYGDDDEDDYEEGFYRYSSTGGKSSSPLPQQSDDEEEREDEEEEEKDSEDISTQQSSDDNGYGDDDDDDEDDNAGYPTTGGKTAPAPPPVRRQIQRAGTYSDEEHNALYNSLRNLRQDEIRRGLPDKERLKDTRLYSKMERDMRNLGYNRSANSCKNYWNRYGRALSGYEERVGTIKNASLVTSAQK